MLTKIERALEQALKARRVQITKGNDKFQAMTPAQQRVRIAKDVLEQIAAKRVLPTNGTYFRPHWDRKLDEGADDLQAALLSSAPACAVCGIGALFMCSVERADHISLQEGICGGSARIREYLRQFFDLDQLHLIEQCFEIWDNEEAGMQFRIHDYAPSSGDAAYRLGKKYKTSLNRMKAIMQNIVDNKGTFKP